MYKHTMALYAIQCKELDSVKIGITTSVYSRLAQLQTSFPIRLQLLFTIPGSYIIERTIHRQLDHARMAGEWFRLSDPKVQDWLNANWPTEDNKQPHLAERPKNQWAILRENVQALNTKRRYDLAIERGVPDRIPIADSHKIAPLRKSVQKIPSDVVLPLSNKRKRCFSDWNE